MDPQAQASEATLNEAALRARLTAHPGLQRIVGNEPEDVATLARAWHLGAVARAEQHPFIRLLLGDHHTYLRDEIDRGIAGIGLPQQRVDRFRRRLVTDRREGYSDAAAAIAELYVALALLRASAHVDLDSRPRGAKAPDVLAADPACRIALEVMGLHQSDEANADADADADAFHRWPKGDPPPARLADRARQLDRAFRVLELRQLPLGDGDHHRRINRLAGKLCAKASAGQLEVPGHEGVLVVSCWHFFGVSGQDLAPAASHWGPTPILRAATLGTKGDTLTDGESFEGLPLQTWEQACDGVLVAPSDARAVLWLFHGGAAALVERSGGAGLSPGARALLLAAFGASRVT